MGLDLGEYTYYSLGGPFLEDFQLLYEFFPEIAMVSIEEDPETMKRQLFHLPCGSLTLNNTDMASYIYKYEPNDRKAIFWLDYTGLEYSHFDDFMTLLGKAAEGSVIKITLQADPRVYWRVDAVARAKKGDEFRRKFKKLMPSLSADPPREIENFAYLVQHMLQIAAERALPTGATPLTFQPFSSFYYSDGTPMFTLTGIIWPLSRVEEIEKAFSNWEFTNLVWAVPRLIDVPILTTKERLHLQQYLPCCAPRGATLLGKMTYLIDEDAPRSEAALEQYAAFHRYSPYFLRGIP